MLIYILSGPGVTSLVSMPAYWASKVLPKVVFMPSSAKYSSESHSEKQIYSEVTCERDEQILDFDVQKGIIEGADADVPEVTRRISLS